MKPDETRTVPAAQGGETQKVLTLEILAGVRNYWLAQGKAGRATAIREVEARVRAEVPDRETALRAQITRQQETIERLQNERCPNLREHDDDTPDVVIPPTTVVVDAQQDPELAAALLKVAEKTQERDGNEADDLRTRLAAAHDRITRLAGDYSRTCAQLENMRRELENTQRDLVTRTDERDRARHERDEVSQEFDRLVLDHEGLVAALREALGDRS